MNAGRVSLIRYVLLFTLVTGLVTLSSCKKDHLTHRAEILVGTWRCERVLLIKPSQPPFIEGDTILWLDEGAIDLQLKFTKRGRITLERDGKCLDRSRIISWSSRESSGTGLTSFFFTCPGFSDNLVEGELGLSLIADNKFASSDFANLMQADALSQGDRFRYFFVKLD